MNSQAISSNHAAVAAPVRIVDWACRIVAAFILLQTLYFKFTAAPESVYIFTRLGEFLHSHLSFIPVAPAERWSRIGSGVLELVAALLLLMPRYTWAGAGLAIAATAGAIASHLTFLGIEVQGDKGLLFGLAITVVVTSSIALYLNRRQIPFVGERF